MSEAIHAMECSEKTLVKDREEAHKAETKLADFNFEEEKQPFSFEVPSPFSVHFLYTVATSVLRLGI